MRIPGIIGGALLLAATTGATLAQETTCDTIRTDLTGRNIFGQHTMQELSDDAQAGNCDAAAGLTRRARNAAGFLQNQCPAAKDLLDLANQKFQLGEKVLKTPQCQN